MKRWVDFQLGDDGIVTRGFAGSNKPLPIDAMADFYFSHTNTYKPISVTIWYTDGGHGT